MQCHLLAALQVAGEVIRLPQPAGSIPHRQEQGAGAGMGEALCDSPGAANKRLYQFRLQTTDRTFEQSPVRSCA